MNVFALFRHSLLVLLFVSDPVVAGVLATFQPTTSSRGQAIDSSLPKDTLSSLLFNPSTLFDVASGDHSFEPSIGYVSLNATYEHPQFDPVRLNMKSPIASFGASHRLGTNADFKVGYGIFPSSFQDFEINGLPKRVDGKTESVFVKNRLRNIMAPLGFSYRQKLNSSVIENYSMIDGRSTLSAKASKPSYWSMGATWILTYDERKLFGRSIADGTELVDMNGRWTGARWVLGASLSDQDFDLGISWMPPTKKKFKGVTYVAGYTEPKSTDQVEFAPGRLSGSTKLSVIQTSGLELLAQVDANRVLASKSFESFDGISRKAKGSDTRDVTQWGGSFLLDFAASDALSLGFGHEPAWMRDGQYSVEPNGLINHKLGTTFGQTNGMDLRSIGFAWKHRPTSATDRASESNQQYNSEQRYHWTFGVQNIRGNHTVDGFGDNPGFFSLDLWLLSCDLGVVL